MYIPAKRNRNIGTPKQGHGIDNKLVIPDSWHDNYIFYEKLDKYIVVRRLLKAKEYVFLVEYTRQDSYHSCTIDDIIRILSYVKESDLEGLNLIVLRQPKRKEETLNPVWGRLCYFIEVDNRFEGPAIIIEAMDFSRKIKYKKSQKPENKKEFERIIEDGHQLIEDKKVYIFQPTINNNRNTQLYRTLLHEIGHYIQYLQLVEHSTNTDDRWYDYDRISGNEKEVFAHNYADTTRKKLEESGLLPFDRIIDLESIKRDNLRLEDFIKNE